MVLVLGVHMLNLVIDLSSGATCPKSLKECWDSLSEQCVITAATAEGLIFASMDTSGFHKCVILRCSGIYEKLCFGTFLCNLRML